MTKHTLKALEESAERNKLLYQYEKPNRSLLEWFPSPFKPQKPEMLVENPVGEVHIEVPEFSCLCPKTGQPDYATIEIWYTPHRRCVESKSLKLYLMSFRQYGTFHEACTQEIFDALDELLQPLAIKVVGHFAPRGGIRFTPTVVG